MSERDFSAATTRLGRAARQGPDRRRETAHLTTLQSQIDAIARGDFAAVLQDTVDDITLDIFAPPEFPWIRSARGAPAFREAIKQNFESVVDQHPVVRDVFAEGETVVLFGRETGRILSTGVAYDLEFVERFTFRDGRLCAVQVVAAGSVE